MQGDKEYSRPASLTDVKTIIGSLNDKGAAYILIGGYALFAHGYHRATEDIDFLIPAGTDNARLLIDALMILPDQAISKVPLDWFDGTENIRLADEIVIDLIFRTCGETYEALQPYVELIDLDGIPVTTLNLKGLLMTKQSNRQKDVLDRAILEKVINAMR